MSKAALPMTVPDKPVVVAIKRVEPGLSPGRDGGGWLSGLTPTAGFVGALDRRRSSDKDRRVRSAAGFDRSGVSGCAGAR